MSKNNDRTSWDATLGKRDQDSIAEPMGLTLVKGASPKANARNPERRIKSSSTDAEA